MRQKQSSFALQSLPLICCVALMLGVLGQRVHAAASIDDVQIGFQGQHKQGYWTPVWVTVTASESSPAGRLEILSLDGNGLPVRSGGTEFSVTSGESMTLLRYVKIGRQDRGLTVELRVGDQPTIRQHVSYVNRPLPTNPDSELIVSLGGEIGVPAALSLDASAVNPTTIQLKTNDHLPLDWFGYEGVDAIVMTTHDNPLLDSLSRVQAEAIRQWVEMGGHVILFLGESGERIAKASIDSPLRPLAELLPGRFVDVVTLDHSAALENYTGGGQALRFSDERRLHMTILDEVRGNLDLYDIGVNGRRPMVIRAPFGFGQVTFVAFDLDQPPLSTWPGRSRMVVKLLRGESAQENRTAGRQQSGQLSHVGYHDMVGQLRGALDQYEGVSFVAFSVVATLILVYIVLIGPVDFFVVKNVFKRMQLTWVTFPLIVVAFVALALILKLQLKNDAILVNQVDLVDLDMEAGLLRGTTWAHVYSPVTETYDIAVLPMVTRDASAPTTSLLSWQGMPGAGLGGLSSTSSTTPFAQPYAISAETASPMIAGLPIPTGSTTAISSRWWQHVPADFSSTLTADNDDLLRGEVTNPLAVELHDCMIFYSVWAYHLERSRGRLSPGQIARAEDERPRNLQWRMTRRAVKDMKDVSTPWDPASFDVPRIMEMMMFQDVAGGDQYTKLIHQYQDYVDLSKHLRSGRAILIGRIDERGTNVAVDGRKIAADAGRHWTFCRIVFPVERVNAQTD